MTEKISRRLVIDAAVARAAGDAAAVDPGSKHCRDFLEAARTICHRAVMPGPVYAEWKNHRSNFSRKWHRQMHSQKKVDFLRDVDEGDLVARIEALDIQDSDKSAMTKDAHLINAAMATDNIVISLDDRSRRLFANLSGQISVLSGIHWVNPNENHDQLIRWLQAGARPRKDLKLGALAEAR